MVDPVREFIRAFNDRDLDGFVAVLDPDIELHSAKGLRKGLKAARLWATREPGGVQQTVVPEALYEDSDKAVALIVRRWHWEESGELAGEEEMAWAFELRDRKVLSWRPYGDRAEALVAVGFSRE